MQGSYDWNFSVFVPYIGAFLRGVWITILLSALSSLVGTILGIATAPLLRLRYFGNVLTLVNDMLRAIPLLVLMFFFYYFPYKQLLGITPPSAFFAALSALTLAQMNFTADIVRAAIDGVSEKTILGARALGLQDSTIWIYVILPDVLRQVMPTLVAFWIGNVKLSSLASVIGTEDVVFVASLSVSQTFRSLEAWVIVALVYIALVMPCTWAARKLEKSSWMLRRSA